MGIAHRLGAFGRQPIADVIDHARGFVAALAEVTGTIVDLGSGGGTPGLIIAAERPDLELILIDRRAGRVDVLDRMIARLGYVSRVRTLCVDASDLVSEPWAPVDAVVARRFGAAHKTLAIAQPLIGPKGIVIVSEPPAAERWNERTLAGLGLRRRPFDVAPGTGRVAVFERST